MKKSHIILVALVMLGLLMGCSEGGGEKVNDPTGGVEKVVEHYSDGQEKEEGKYNKNGKQEGRWIYRHANGQKRVEGIYNKDGKKDGLWVFWHENGQKAGEGEYKARKGPVNEEEHGQWTYWYENGQKKGEGKYKTGMNDGPWTFWNEDGSINNEKSGIYKAGKKVAPLPNKK